MKRAHFSALHRGSTIVTQPPLRICDCQTRSSPKFQSQNPLKELHAISTTKATPDISIWSYLIKGYLSRESPEEVLLLFTQIRRNGLHHVALLPLILKACSSLGHLLHGRSVHSVCIKTGEVANVMTGTSVVALYSKCGKLIDAHHAFDEMPNKNVISFNAMIGGYTRNGDLNSASLLFRSMAKRTSVTWSEMIGGFARSGNTLAARHLFDQAPPETRNLVMWTVMVDGYASNGEMDSARMLFEAMPERNFFAWSSMIAGYCKMDAVEEAQKMFARIPVKNLVIWNTLISGYAQNGFCQEALNAFEEMLEEGFDPDEVTVASALSACAQLGVLDSGKRIHAMIDANGIKINQFVLNGLVDMYAKCGDFKKAKQIFEGMHRRNDVCWNAMISGLAIHGQCKDALDLFVQMESLGEKPNESTFLAVLSACAHGGFVNEGLEIFVNMKEKYGLDAGMEHFGCLVDLLGRSGRLQEAYGLIKTMPMKPNDAVWGALLGACRIHMDMVMAEQVVQEAGMQELKANGNDDACFVLMSNIYAASDRWEQAENLRIMMKKHGVQKTIGCSSIAGSG